MKRTFTLTFLFSTLVLRIFAYSGGPDPWGYTWKDSNEPGGPVYNWIDILGEGATEVKLLQDDNIRGPFPINFNFHYYWYDVDQFYVGSNGYISFQFGNLASPFFSLPNSATPNDIVGPFMNDLTFTVPTDSAKCYYKVNAAHDTLIVSYLNVPFYDIPANGGSVGSNTFQIILSAVDSSITFQYKEQIGNAYGSAFTYTGIENNSGTIGLTWTNFMGGINPPANYAIKYYPPHNSTLVVSDATILYNDNSETGALFLPANSLTPHLLTTAVKNWGNVPLDSFNVHGIVKDGSGNQIVIDDFTTDSLDVSESQIVTFTYPLLTGAPGDYKFIATSQLSGDDVQIDDSKKQELVVVDTTQLEIRLSYDNGNTSNITSVNWVGGEGGVGMYFIPPVYPCHVTKLHYYIISNTGSSMSARIFDDDGISGLPYTLYDSVYVNSADIAVGAWTDVILPNPVTITSGGFYVAWDMQGENIALACSLSDPFSNRSYEVFQNGWGFFRFHETQEPLINATIESGFPTGVDPSSVNGLDLQVFPNPATDNVTIAYSSASNQKIWLVLTDLQGKIVSRWDLGNAGTGSQLFNIDANRYPAGMYLVELYSGNERKMSKLVITD
jgi:hypothetical protein